MSTKSPLQASLVCSESRHHPAEVGVVEQAALVAQTSRVAIRCSFWLFPSPKALHAACEPLDRELVELCFKFRALPKGTLKMSAAEIANMFDALRDMVVSALVAEQDQRSLLLQQQQEQDGLIVELQQRIQYLEQALSDMSSEFQLVRQQLVEQEQEDNAADAVEWKAARSSVARLLRSSWYNKAAEREQQELPKEAVEVNCTLLTSRVREPEASQQWKPEPPGETVSHTQEDTKRRVEVSPPQEQEDPQKCKPQPPAIRRTWKCVWSQGMDVRRWPQTARQNIIGYLSRGEIFEVAEERRFRDGSEGFFLRLANKQGWVFSKTRSGTFCIQVDDSCRQYSNHLDTTASHDAWTWDNGTTKHQRDHRGWQEWSDYSSDSSTSTSRWPAAKSWDSWAWCKDEHWKTAPNDWRY